MDNIIDEINELRDKRDKAQDLLTRYKIKLETLTTERDELVKKLNEVYNTTIEEAPNKLAELKSQFDSLLDEAKQSLDKINL